MAAFAEKWGPALAGAGHTQIPDGLLDGKISRALQVTNSQIKTLIGIIRAQGKYGYVESAKQLAYDSRVSYNQTRTNLKVLSAHKKDGGKALLIPVILPSGRTRYNWMPLRKELEKLEELEKRHALEVVKPVKVRPAPKPTPIVTIHEPDPDAWVQKSYQPDEEAIADWEEIKLCIKEEMPAPAYETWVAGTRGDHWEGAMLVVAVTSSGHRDVLEGWRDTIKRCCRIVFGNISIAFRVVLAATVGV